MGKGVVCSQAKTQAGGKWAAGLVRQFSVGKQAKQRQKYVYQRDVRILENWRRENLDNFEYIMVLLYYR